MERAKGGGDPSWWVPYTELISITGLDELIGYQNVVKRRDATKKQDAQVHVNRLIQLFARSEDNDSKIMAMCVMLMTVKTNICSGHDITVIQ
jgi:hypothetical protein